MAFDFKKAKAAASKPKPIKPMKGIIIGTSGAGKSSLLGTTGLDLLLLHSKTEEHSAMAAETMAKEYGTTVTPVDFTVWAENKKGEKVIDATATCRNLLSILADLSQEKDQLFGAVAVDSITELQGLFMQSDDFFNGCKTDKGVHNTYKEGEVFTQYMEKVRDLAIALQGAGVHFFCTMAANKSGNAAESGSVEYSPELRGFKVAQSLVRMFDDVLLIDRVEDEETEEESHKLLFRANLTKKSKDVRGNVVKSMNFQPRVSGFRLQDLPETAAADLSKIIEGRAKRFKGE